MFGHWAVVVSYEEGDDVWSYFDKRDAATRNARRRVSEGYVDPIEEFSGKPRRVAIVYCGEKKIAGTEAWTCIHGQWYSDSTVPLRAFGEAVAMVARARLLSRAADRDEEDARVSD